MKSVKNLIVPFCILIALIFGVVIYQIVSSRDHNDTVESSGGMIDVVYFNSSDILSISVFNREKSQTTVVNSSIDSNGSVYYEYQGDDKENGAKYSQGRLSDFVNNLIYFSSYAKVSTESNYEEYGLDDPRFVITINTINGNSTIVNLGNKTPDGTYCYMYVTGSPDVYIVSTVKMFYAEKNSINFLDSTLLSVDYSELKSVHFDRKNDSLSLDALVVCSSPRIADFEIYKPYHHDASPYFGNLIDSITALEISEYIDIDKDELNRFGLDDPNFHFVLTKNNGQKIELFISSKINEYYYGYMTGFDKYFILSEYQLEGIELQELVLIDPYIHYCFVKDISSINCTYGDDSFKYELNIPTGESITSDKARVTLDGRNAKISDSEGRSYCSILFESLACIKIGGIDIDAKLNLTDLPVISLTYIDNNYSTEEYVFYIRDTDSYYVYKNGEYTGFYVYSREIFNNGGTDTYSYGFWSAYELLNEAINNNSNGIYDIPTE